MSQCAFCKGHSVVWVQIPPSSICKQLPLTSAAARHMSGSWQNLDLRLPVCHPLEWVRKLPMLHYNYFQTLYVGWQDHRQGCLRAVKRKHEGGWHYPTVDPGTAMRSKSV